VKTAVALPGDYIVRPPEPGDAKAIFHLYSACNIAVGPEVAVWVLEQALQRAQEMGRVAGHAEITVESYIYRADEPLGALLRDHGFAAGTTYHRMRRDHTGPVPAAVVPADIVVRRGVFDDAGRRAAHDVMIESFRDQFGFVPRPHAEWVEAREAQATFDWSQLTVLEVNRRAVAIRDCSDTYLETENCGHIGMLGVVQRFRGRGLAKYLLYDAFAQDAAAGRAGTILHVDTNNPTQALGLYQSVGMTPTLSYTAYRRTLQVT